MTGIGFLESFALICDQDLGREAVVSGKTVLSFEKLDSLSNQIARHLLANGLEPGDTLAMLGRPGIDPVVTMLATLKAGATWLPLDSAEPVERINWKLRRSDARFLISQRPVDSIEEHIQSIAMDSEREAIAAQSAAALDVPYDPLRIAYCIFTSGSSGGPKCAEIEHRNLAELIVFLQSRFRLSIKDRVAHAASLSFDASIWEICMGLLCGGSLACISRHDLTPADFADELRRLDVTVATLTPSYLREIPHQELTMLHTLISAGEVCPREMVETWAPGRRMFNAYGPTETTICATIGRCDPGRTGKPSIGRPIAGTKIHLLDDDFAPVPDGEEGEIYIEGGLVGRGYRSDGAFTAERWIEPPWSKSGSRFYRTGDFARVLPHGDLEFIGRKDRQLKIRGTRINLEEIEELLNTHPQVTQCVVLQIDKSDNDGRLAAIVVQDKERMAEGSSDLNGGQLREFAETMLPQTIVPNHFLLVDQIPRLASGKPDLDALADIIGHSELPDGRSSSAENLEAVIAKTWCRHLGHAAVSDGDHFLEIGGHSLIAVRVISDLRDHFGVHLALRLLFAHPIFADFVKAIADELES